jgi:hypothetical protein
LSLAPWAFRSRIARLAELARRAKRISAKPAPSNLQEAVVATAEQIINAGRKRRAEIPDDSAPPVQEEGHRVAHGDIAHSVGDDYPHGVYLGIELGTPPNGAGWKQVLTTGALLPAVKIQYPSERANVVKITGGDAATGTGTASAVSLQRLRTRHVTAARTGAGIFFRST